MLEEVKKIKLEELNKEKIQYEGKRDIINQQVEQLYEQLWQLQSEQNRGLTVKSNFSFLEKLVTRRREYKKFKEQSKRFYELPTLISKVENELAEEKQQVNQELETSGISAKLEEITQSISSLENAQTLWEIGITPIEAMELLENNGLQPVLSESDKNITVHPRDYSSKSSLIGVHKTKYAPTANMIKSAKDANVEYQSKITLNGVEYEYSYKSARNTVHMSMNDEVSSHLFGSWDSCKYAILVPFDDIPNEKIARAEPMDTFTRGSIELSENSWILCPKNEVDRLKTFNPKAHVLGYEGENVQGYPTPFLTQLGYRGEDVGMWSWHDNESVEQFFELTRKQGIKTGPHTGTYFHEDEQLLNRINQTVALSNLLRDNHLITNSEDIENISKQLDDKLQSFGLLLSDLCTKTNVVESDIEPQSIKANKKQADIFLQEMKNNGFNISPIYQNIIRKLCEVSLFDCDKNNQDTVFSIDLETTEEERKTVEELQDVLSSDKYVADENKKCSAFKKFISTAIFDSILHSQVREISKKEVPEEQSL